ncbi:MAG TPA: 4-(cytidine 5'-diphospho)-2-C-methyl-D-erythritol kinase [Acidimicrobiales bacterium]
MTHRSASTTGPGGAEGPGPGPVELTAPAKLTLSLRVTGRRPDGFHLLESVMVSLDLADTLVFGEGEGLSIEEEFTGVGLAGGVRPGPDNLISRALVAVGRSARVHLVKRVPPGAGLGGGSADAAAVLRWCGVRDLALAAGLGSDVPFCLVGGRALVRGAGEQVAPLPYEEQAYTLFLLPFGMDTRAVYAAWDRRHPRGGRPDPGPAAGVSGPEGVNDLEAPALDVEPRLGAWRDHLARLTGRRPWLAGSGSTWFVAGTPEESGLDGRPEVSLGSERAVVVPVRTVPTGWPGADHPPGRA